MSGLSDSLTAPIITSRTVIPDRFRYEGQSVEKHMLRVFYTITTEYRGMTKYGAESAAAQFMPLNYGVHNSWIDYTSSWYWVAPRGAVYEGQGAPWNPGLTLQGFKESGQTEYPVGRLANGQRILFYRTKWNGPATFDHNIYQTGSGDADANGYMTVSIKPRGSPVLTSSYITAETAALNPNYVGIFVPTNVSVVKGNGQSWSIRLTEMFASNPIQQTGKMEAYQ